jgi:hypothetical protein
MPPQYAGTCDSRCHHKPFRVLQDLSWPNMHIRASFVVRRPAGGGAGGRGCPAGSCDRHSAACPMLVMAHCARYCCGFSASCLSREEPANLLLPWGHRLPLLPEPVTPLLHSNGLCSTMQATRVCRQ